MQSEGAYAEASQIDDGLVRLAGGFAKGDGYIGASLGERERGGASETLGPAGDETGFATQRLGIMSDHSGILLPNFSGSGNRNFCRPHFVFFSCQRMRQQRYNPPVPDSRKVVVYSRKGCHLCEVVKESLEKLSRRGGFTWQEVDVDSESELRRQFNDEVPVVFIDGRKAFKYRMDEREFLKKLAS